MLAFSSNEEGSGSMVKKPIHEVKWHYFNYQSILFMDLYD